MAMAGRESLPDISHDLQRRQGERGVGKEVGKRAKMKCDLSFIQSVNPIL